MINKIYNFIFKLVCFLGAVFLSKGFNAQIVIPFNSVGTQTWVCPPGVTTLTVECWGAGGGSGGASSVLNAAGGGGGGGAYANSVLAVTPGNTYTINVGAGGASGSSTGGNGTAGANSSFNTTVVMAIGGSGGAGSVSGVGGIGGTGGLNTSSIGTNRFSGGNGATGVPATSGGGGGSSAGNIANGNPGSGAAGGAAPPGGVGGVAANTAPGGAPGLNGFNGGGGAAGARRGSSAINNVGGFGGSGKVELSYFCSPAVAVSTPTIICPGGTATLTASGPLTLDQQSTTGVTTGRWHGGNTGLQTFIAGITGRLVRVRVHTATYGSPATITLRVYSGSPGSGVMLTSVTYGKGAGTNSWDDVILPNGGVNLTNGMPYYLEIPSGAQIDWICSAGNVYGNGQAWFGGSGQTWDWNFETYMDLNTYMWNPGSMPVQTFTASPGVTTNYTATYTTATGCAHSKLVTVNLNPTINTVLNVTNISCNGIFNGSIDLIPSGGTPPYTYLWSNSQVTQDLINLSPGAYNVTLTDATGCTNATGSTVTQPAALTASSAITTSINCNGGTGVVSVSAGGGTPSYSGTGTFTVTAGTYTYNVTDANGCIRTTTINVTQPAPFTINVTASSTICSGTISNLTATGGSTYTWNPGGLTGANVNVTPTSTTSYTATGTSSLGCTATNSLTVTVNPNPTVTVSSSTICAGGTTTLTASGATTYSWSTVTTTPSISVSPGSNTTYTVTGTNAFGCTDTKTTSVTVNPLPSITTTPSPSAICIGSSSNLTAAGATTYMWNPGSLSGSVVTVSPVSTTQYTVTGTNSNGCVNTQTVTLTVNSLPIVTASVSPTTMCAGATATLSAMGGTAYTWNPGAATTQTVIVSPASSTLYTVTATNASGCTNTQTVNLNVNPTFSTSVSFTNVTCNAGNNGGINLTVLGGLPPYTFVWSNSQTTEDITNLPSGVYSVTVTDMIGCTTNVTGVTITQPSLLIATSALTTSINCNGGSGVVSVSASGGVPAYSGTGSFTVTAGTYTYNVTDASGCLSVTAINVTQPATLVINVSAPSTVCLGANSTLTANGASSYTWNPGGFTGASVNVTPASTTIYTTTGTSSLGCVATNTTSVTVNPNPTVTVSSSTICVGGTATLTASGAATYSWSTGATTASISVAPGSNTNYTFTGTNSFGCINTKTTNVTVNSLPIISASAGPASVCVGFNSNLAANGASTYTWIPGGITGSTVNVSPASSTIYTVTGTNSNGCVNTKTVNLTVNSNPTVTATSSSTAICTGATATLTAGGATTYSWSTGSTANAISVSPASSTVYTLTGTNSAGCVNTKTVSLIVNSNPTITAVASSSAICAGSAATLTVAGANTYLWNTGATAAAISVSPLSTTIYTVSGMNSFGCSNTTTVNLTVNSNPTVTAVSSSSSICVGETATLTATGAASYLWDTGSTSSTITVTPLSTNVYTVTGTNGFGCTDMQTVALTVNNNPTITAISSSTSICVGETTTLTASGADSYLWDIGATTPIISVNPVSPTTYTVTGTDANNCSSTETISIGVNALPVVTAASSTPAICAGETATLTAGGASGYIWDTGASTNVISVSPVSSTIYTVTGTDGNGCINTQTLNLIVNSLPVIAASASSTTICAGSGSTLTATGAFSYTWNPGSMTGSIVNVNPSSSIIFTLTGESSSGCTSTQILGIVVNTLPTVTANATATVVCNGQSVTLNGFGATNYAWDNGVVDGIAFTPATTATYIVAGTDGNGCVGSDTINILVNSLPVINAVATSTNICSGDFTNLTGTGATTYTWNPGGLTGSSVSVNPLSTIVYTVSGTNSVGCISSETIPITVNSLPTISTTSSPSLICAGNSSTLIASGANTYTWNPGSINASSTVVNPSASKIYTVTGEDSMGCINTETVSLNVNALPSVSAGISQTAICVGGTVSLTATGANSYTWNPGGLNGAAVVISPTVSTTYTLIGENINGCINTETINVVVNSLPLVGASGSSSVICAGTTATLTATGANTYTWSPGGATGSMLGVSATSATVYTVTGMDGVGCINTETVSLGVNALPLISITPSNSTICSGQSIALTASGANSFTWTSGAISNSVIVSPSSTTIYYLTGTDSNGCEGSASTSVNVVNSPVVSINTPSTNVCFGYTMTVVANGANSYLWSNGESTNSTIIQPFSSSTYSVIGSDISGCSDTAYLSITVLPLPSISASASTSLACAGQTINLSASGSASFYSWQPNSLFGATQNVIITSPTTYTAYGQGSNGCAFFSTVHVDVQSGTAVIPIVTPALICIGDSAVLSVIGGSINSWSANVVPNTQIVTPVVATTYTYTATDLNGCASDITFTVDINIGCDVIIYNGFTPNGDGINDFWVIDNIDKLPDNKVYVYSRWGTKIFETINYNNADNNWDGKFNGNSITTGTYFYIIVDGSENLVRKGWIEITN
ncbi:MAG: gliding motility-associated C-terminal domain-containing protein [Bacteroidota bacterium]